MIIAVALWQAVGVMGDLNTIINEQDFSVKLVEALKKHPCLYNYKLAEYSKKDVTEKAWERVAQEVNETVTTCKAKWKNIRTVFVRKIKPALNGTPASSKSRPYYLNKEMKFLLPFLKPVLNSTNAQKSPGVYLRRRDIGQDIDDDNSEDCTSLTKGTEQDEDIPEESITRPTIVQLKANSVFTNRGHKRKAEMSDVNTSFMEFNDYHANERNEDDFKKMFLLSLLPELDLMNDQQMRQFKRRVLHLIDDILDQRPLSALSTTSSFIEAPVESSHITNIKYEVTDDYQD